MRDFTPACGAAPWETLTMLRIGKGTAQHSEMRDFGWECGVAARWMLIVCVSVGSDSHPGPAEKEGNPMAKKKDKKKDKKSKKSKKK
jgi:hypothetical protein